MAFTAPENYNSSVMVDQNNNLVAPTVFNGDFTTTNLIVNSSLDAGGTNTTELKGCYYEYIDTTNMNGGSGTVDFYLTATQQTFAQGSTNPKPAVDSSFVSGYAVGDVVSIVDDAHMLNCATITAIDGNKITVGSLGQLLVRILTEESSNNGWRDNGGNYSIDYSFYVLAKPTSGIAVINSNAFALGRSNQVLSGEGMAHGSTNVVLGEYGFASGFGLVSNGYSQTVVGKYNELESTPQDASTGSANALVVGNGTASSRSNAFEVKWSGDANLQGDITITNSNIAVGESITTMQQDITEAQSDISTLQGQMTTAQSNITTLQNKTQNITASAGTTTISGTITGASSISATSGTFDSATVGGEDVSTSIALAQSLQVSKVNTGMLYFTGRPYGTNDLMSVGELFSVAYRTDFQFAEGSATTDQYRPWNIGSNTAYIAPMALGDGLLRISYNGSGFYSFKGANIRAAVQDINSIVAIVNNPTGGNITITLYVNGVQIPQNSYTARAAQTFTGYKVNARGGTPSLMDTTMKDFAVFNFDMSAGGAPYSIADYSAGKPVPPSALSQTAVLLENYTFTVGSTQYIPDVSGNNNDATIAGTGTVAGTFDKAIAKLASLITSTNA